MEYERSQIDFSNGPIVSIKATTSSHLRFISVEATCVAFECARCGYKTASQICEYEKEDDSYGFDCPKCHLRYWGGFFNETMHLCARWLEYKDPEKGVIHEYAKL